MRKKLRLTLLRGVCQLPAYVAHARGHFGKEGLESTVTISPTAWMIPEQLADGRADFAVIPWTRVAASEEGEAPIRVVCGSGVEEAAIVVRAGLEISDVRSVAVPREGGMKDLTALGLLDDLGWSDGRVELRRFPSGDGAIICFTGLGADAASMVEPYATMMEDLGIGRVVRRTGDLWPGVPGCSLATSARLIEEDPELVQSAVCAFCRAADDVREDPELAAGIGASFIGVHPSIVRNALRFNQPDLDCIRSPQTMDRVLRLMGEVGYAHRPASEFCDLRFLESARPRVAVMR